MVEVKICGITREEDLTKLIELNNKRKIIEQNILDQIDFKKI